MKLFISQPMKGLTQDQILEARDVALNEAQNLMARSGADVKVEILETYFDDFGPDAKPLEYIGRSIEYLAKADLAYFGKGWDTARGCKIEHLCAKEYGVPTLEYKG